MHVADDGTLTMIPVQIRGVPVGAARISESGNLEIFTGWTSARVKEFKEKLERGDAIGIGMYLIPK